jgi:hypothetical protein
LAYAFPMNLIEILLSFTTAKDTSLYYHEMFYYVLLSLPLTDKGNFTFL